MVILETNPEPAVLGAQCHKPDRILRAGNERASVIQSAPAISYDWAVRNPGIQPVSRSCESTIRTLAGSFYGGRSTER